MVRRRAPAFERLVAALHEPALYPHPVERVESLETHASVVLLAGDYAYKLKKPVRLGFLDYGDLEKRRFFCGEELRLNRRTAPQLYLDVVAITGSADRPALGGEGLPIEFAVRMRRFGQETLLDAMARERSLRAEHAKALADTVAQFHAGASRAGAAGEFAGAELVLAAAEDNFRELRARGARTPLAQLESWTLREHARARPLFEARRHEGRVRECHGDLHLGNIALLDGQPVPFDGIEFSEALRWIDVASEIAFLYMDLRAHGCDGLAHLFVSRYLERTGDYACLELLRFYAVYRALVRAKVAAIREAQSRGDARASLPGEACQRHLALAWRLAVESRQALVVMHGFSGSGKTTVSERLIAALGMLRCRSDVERKRLHGLAAGARTASPLQGGIYGAAQSAATYDRLAGIARTAVAAGIPALVDASFLRRAERQRFREMASELGVPFAIVSCSAPPGMLERRANERKQSGSDASEAGAEVLALQRQTGEPLSSGELRDSFFVDTRERDVPPETIAALAARLELRSAP